MPVTSSRLPLCTRINFTYTYALVRVQSYLVGGGLIIEANIPVQELEGQRGEGAYFRRGLIFGSIHVNSFHFGTCRTVM